ncbi:putative sodium-dependent multivitamin transporter isoform X2 [Copidosoma floridanum]|uniref:putative sodium-dependent multivitamin transporter isoform X2 n=1 Tax=Copidosoma floridanum TaxID=29053 RepID=UPI000C6F79EC|nr:putative sodium-dependent multivitamin transporter isoform X2 [Copidosoma floridanum]
MEHKIATLDWADLAVIAVAMGISVIIGLYYRFSGGKQKTIQEYFSADKSMNIIPIAIGLMVSFVSAITLLGISAENYTYGTQFFVINLSYLIGTPLVCYGYMPVFFNIGAISAFEYLEKRFGRASRVVAGIIYWIQLLLYSGVVLYAPALTLEATTGIDKIWSIVGIGVICAFYCTLGGIKAVLITDVFQGGLMFTSLFIIIFTAAHKVGGFSEIWRIASEGKRIQFDEISLDPTIRHTWWGLLIGGLGSYLSLYGVNQVQIQRMMTTNIKSARLALWLSWPILAFLSALTCYSGLAMYSYYYKCDPKTTNRIESMDMLMPLFVMDTLSNVPGLPGLFVAGIFSAGLSTISAGLNSLAAVTLEDYIKPMYSFCSGHKLSENQSIVCSKILVLVFGISCIALAFAAQLLGGILQASLTIFGVVGGPLLGIFTLGMLVESANEIGAITGTLISFAFCMWIAFGQPRPLPPKLPVDTYGCSYNFNASISFEEAFENDSSYFYLYKISYIWYSVIGFLITMALGYVISNLSRVALKIPHDEPDPQLFFPFIASRIKKRRLQTEINQNRQFYTSTVCSSQHDNCPNNEE